MLQAQQPVPRPHAATATRGARERRLRASRGAKPPHQFRCATAAALLASITSSSWSLDDHGVMVNVRWHCKHSAPCTSPFGCHCWGSYEHHASRACGAAARAQRSRTRGECCRGSHGLFTPMAQAAAALLRSLTHLHRLPPLRWRCRQFDGGPCSITVITRSVDS